MWCWHKWLPWGDPIATGELGNKQQWRVCGKCNKAQFRTLEYDEQTSPAAVKENVESTRKKEY